MNTLARTLCQSFLLVGGLTAAAVCSADTKIDRSVDMSPRGRVSVSNVSGSVEVKGWDRAEVKLTGTLGDNVERLRFESDDGNVEIEVELEKGGRKWNWKDRGADSDLVLRVPRESRLSVDTVSADIEVRDHLGDQDIDSVSGDINAQTGNDENNYESVSGTLTLEGRNADAELSADAVSGNIRIRNFRGDLEAEAVSGDVIVRDSYIADGEFESVSGDIDLNIELDNDGGLDIETVSGDVTLRFEGKVDAEFDIDTHSGRIDEFWGNRAKRTSRYGPGRELSFSVGGGGAEVNVTTLSGDVENRSAD